MLETFMHSQTVTKTFVFEQEQTHRSVIVEYMVDLTNKQIDLGFSFEQYCPLVNNDVSIYDPSLNKFVSLSKIGAAQSGIVPLEFLEPSFVLIRYHPIDPMAQQSIEQSFSENSQQIKKSRNKQRNKQRTIGEVIQLVKRWREYFMVGYGSHKRRVNLQEAAKLVKVSKKSLDDYYFQLRLGQFHDFDFQKHFNQKVGYLRTYVKGFKAVQNKPKIKNQHLKHPTKLKVIEDNQLITRSFQAQQIINQNFNKTTLEKKPDFDQINNFFFDQCKQITPLSVNFMNLQQDFFKEFEDGDNFNDPYLAEEDFKRKDYYQESFSNDNFLF